MTPITIAVLTDLHLASPAQAYSGPRRCDLAKSLLSRAVSELDAEGPQVTVVLGDLVDDGRGPNAATLYRELREILGTLRSPTVVLPGNHDGDEFFEAFPRPRIADHAGMRFLSLLDPEEPGYNARRTEEGFELMRESRRGYDGPITALQHVPVFPPLTTSCPYGYLNAEEVLREMRRQGIRLALAGHYHAGFAIVRADGLCLHATPALCEEPFCYDLIRTDGATATAERRSVDSVPI